MNYATSPAGLALIQEHEGFCAEPAQMPDGNWVVGYGHIRVGEAGAPIGQAEAAGLLALDLAPVERLVNAHVTARLTQSQFDALVSFAVSVGAEAFVQSQVLRRINNAEFVAASCAMDAWRKSDVGGELEVVDALVRRRASEKAMFLKDLPYTTSPSAFMRAKLDYAASVLGAPVAYAPARPVGATGPAVAHAVAAVAQNIFSAPPTRPEPALRLTQILRSEPATEALLLTQVVANDRFEEDGEIVTAHAKPTARKIEALAAPLPRDRRISKLRRRARPMFKLPRFTMPGFNFGQSFETLGLTALVLFGAGLTLIGGSMLYSGNGDVIDLVGAAAFATPGLAAVLMGGYGLLGGAHA